MKCVLTRIGDAPIGHLYCCDVCGVTHESSLAEPAKIKRRCAGARVGECVPGESRKPGWGDRVKQVTDALGIPQCVPCGKRQAALNALGERTEAAFKALGAWFTGS